MLGRLYFQQGYFAIIFGLVAIAASDNHTTQQHNFLQRGITSTDSSLGGMCVDDFFFETLKLTHAYSASPLYKFLG